MLLEDSSAKYTMPHTSDPPCFRILEQKAESKKGIEKDGSHACAPHPTRRFSRAFFERVSCVQVYICDAYTRAPPPLLELRESMVFPSFFVSLLSSIAYTPAIYIYIPLFCGESDLRSPLIIPVHVWVDRSLSLLEFLFSLRFVIFRSRGRERESNTQRELAFARAIAQFAARLCNISYKPSELAMVFPSIRACVGVIGWLVG